MTDERPVLFVTGHAPPERVGAFAALHERENVMFALFGGRALHHSLGVEDLPFPHLRVSQREVGGLAGSGEYRAVVGSTGGRVALPAAVTRARRARVPFLLWSSMWAHPWSVAGAAGFLPLRRIYRTADAVVTYGPHVSAYVRSRGARNVYEAPQAVDNAYWSAAGNPQPVRELAAASLGGEPGFVALFVGRTERQKGLGELLEAWRRARHARDDAALVLVGVAADAPQVYGEEEVVAAGRRPYTQLRNFYAAADVLVVPSVPTRTVRETWGLVVNEAMCQSTPVIATDAVGAAAGGLVRPDRNGLIVPAGEPAALAEALRRVAADDDLRARLGAAAREDVGAHTFDAWAAGFSAALASVQASRAGKDC